MPIQEINYRENIPDDAIIVSSPLVLDESRYPTLVGAGQWIHVY